MAKKPLGHTPAAILRAEVSPLPVRVAVIGAGRRAADHLEALAELNDAEIAAICDIRGDAARDGSDKYGGKPYSNYRQMLGDDVADAAYIITPPTTHHAQALGAFQAGLHVFLEKPVTLSENEADELLAAAERAGAVTSVSYQLRYLSTVDRALAELRGRAIALLHGQYYWTIPLVPWAAKRRTGGGQIVEQATHIVDLCRLFAGEVTSVSAAYAEQTRTGLTEFDNWDACAMTMTFAGGAVGSLASTYALFPGVPENAMLDVTAGRKDAAPPIEPGDEVLLRLSVDGTLRKYTRDGHERIEPTGRADLECSRAFIKAISTGDRSAIRSDLADAVRTLQVTLAANKAAETGEVVVLT
jgi:predicted dehydrogenase